MAVHSSREGEHALGLLPPSIFAVLLATQSSVALAAVRHAGRAFAALGHQ
jgi:hypothetical protein